MPWNHTWNNFDGQCEIDDRDGEAILQEHRKGDTVVERVGIVVEVNEGSVIQLTDLHQRIVGQMDAASQNQSIARQLHNPDQQLAFIVEFRSQITRIDLISTDRSKSALLNAQRPDG